MEGLTFNKMVRETTNKHCDLMSKVINLKDGATNDKEVDAILELVKELHMDSLELICLIDRKPEVPKKIQIPDFVQNRRGA